MNFRQNAMWSIRLASTLLATACASGVANAVVHYQLSERLQFDQVAFDASSKVLYALDTTRWDNRLLRWDAESGRALGPITRPIQGTKTYQIAPELDLAVSEGSTSENRGQHFIWKLSNGEVIAKFTADVRSEEYQKLLAFSADGQIRAMQNAKGVIQLLSLPQGNLIASLNGHMSSAAKFSRDGSLLASGGGGVPVQIWDLTQGQARGTLEKENRLLFFSPDGLYLFTENEEVILVWDLRSLLPVARFEHLRADFALKFSPDGTRLLAASEDSLCEWQYDPSQFLRAIPSTGNERLAHLSLKPADLPKLTFRRSRRTVVGSPLTISPDGRFFASCGYYGVRLWHSAVNNVFESTVPRRQLIGPGNMVDGIVFSPDGERLATAGHGSVNLWSFKSGEHLQEWHYEQLGNEKFGSLSFSGDGRKLMLAVTNIGLTPIAKVWDATAGREIFVAKYDDEFGMRMKSRGKSWPNSSQIPPTITPNGASVAWVAPWDNHLMLFDFTSGKPSRHLVDPTRGQGAGLINDGKATTLTFSKDGRMLVSGHSGGMVKLWDAATGKWRGNFLDPALKANSGNIRDLLSHAHEVSSVAISPKGELVASADRMTLKFWDTRSGALLHSIEGRFSSLTFSTDRLLFAVSEHGGQIWDTSAFRLCANVNTYFQGSRSAFSPDGRYIAVSGADRIALIDGEPYDGLFYGGGIAYENSRWLGRELTQLGYLKPKDKFRAAAYSEGDVTHLALTLPQGAAADEVIVASIRDRIRAVVAARFNSKLMIHLCGENFQIERTIEVERPLIAVPPLPEEPEATQAFSSLAEQSSEQKPVAKSPAGMLAEATPFGAAPAETVGLNSLQGDWRVEKMLVDGKPAKFDNSTLYRFDGTRLVVVAAGEQSADMTYTVDASATPHTLDLTLHQSGKKAVSRTIYKIEDGTLTICHGLPNTPRPTEFSPKADTMRRLIELQRIELGL